MATSVATLTYGAYSFGPIPQVGWNDAMQRTGMHGTGPGVLHRTITLSGRVKGNDLNAVQAKFHALRAALEGDRKTLVYNDGSATRLNDIAHVTAFNTPEQWGQYEQTYTISLTMIPLSVTRVSPIAVSYGSFVFAAASANTPWPTIARNFTVEREGQDGARGVTRAKVTLTGWFEEGSQAAAETKIAALVSALSTDNLTLTYGTWSQACKIESWDVPEDILDKVVPYTAIFLYNVGTGGPGTGVTKFSSSREITRVVNRNRKHFVPFRNHATVQNLRESSQMITATGFAVADTLANARAAAVDELALMLPATGYEEEGSTIRENPREVRVDWNVSKFYTAPVLRGGVYGG